MIVEEVMKMLANRGFEVTYGCSKGTHWAVVTRQGVTYYRAESKHWKPRELIDFAIAQEVIHVGLAHLAPAPS